MSDKCVKCVKCPECNCVEYTHKDACGVGYRICANCNQEWRADIDYTENFDQDFLNANQSATGESDD